MIKYERKCIRWMYNTSHKIHFIKTYAI
jgi:hypothetical protein